jgi:type I restriction enzyme M protein
MNLSMLILHRIYNKAWNQILNMQNISAIIRSVRDIMRKDVGVDGDAQRISQLVWMLFLKIYSDKEQVWSSNKDYVSPLLPRFKWQNWATSSNSLSDDDLISFINSRLFPSLKKLKTPSVQAGIIRSVFEDTHNYMKNGNLFRKVTAELDKIDFKSTSESHIFNEIYESILKELQSAGSSGEYYTPRAVTKFMVEVIKPTKNNTILDPACGTGGFLTCSLEYLRPTLKTEKDLQQLQTRIRGVEKKPLPHLLCTTNLMLHGIQAPNVIRDNLLGRRLSEWTDKDKIDIIFSNPPFGGIEEDEINRNFPSDFQTKETADLFVSLIIELLKPNGRAAIILPDNFLFGEGVRTRIKEHLLKTCNLHTIVRLPNGVFNPYTSIKTNLLFFDKGQPTSEIWYYEHLLPSGQKNYSKSRPISFDEFDPELSWWDRRHEMDNAWRVSIKDIRKRNFNLDISSPYHGEDVENYSSSDLRKQLEKSMDRSKELLALMKIDFQ